MINTVLYTFIVFNIEKLLLSYEGVFSAYGSQLKEDLRKNTYWNRIHCNVTLCIYRQFKKIYKYSCIIDTSRPQILTMFWKREKSGLWILRNWEHMKNCIHQNLNFEPAKIEYFSEARPHCTLINVKHLGRIWKTAWTHCYWIARKRFSWYHTASLSHNSLQTKISSLFLEKQATKHSIRHKNKTKNNSFWKIYIFI